MPPAGSLIDGNQLFNVTVNPVDSPPRSFLGDQFERTWDNTEKPCIYAGNSQGGPSGEESLPGSVIEGVYTDYVTDSLFDTDFEFDRIKGACAV